jgi:hypothetical protein
MGRDELSRLGRPIQSHVVFLFFSTVAPLPGALGQAIYQFHAETGRLPRVNDEADVAAVLAKALELEKTHNLLDGGLNEQTVAEIARHIEVEARDCIVAHAHALRMRSRFRPYASLKRLSMHARVRVCACGCACVCACVGARSRARACVQHAYRGSPGRSSLCAHSTAGSSHRRAAAACRPPARRRRAVAQPTRGNR